MIRPPALRPAPVSLARRQPSTVINYRRCLLLCLKWCDYHGVSFSTPWQLDDLLVEWQVTNQATKSQFAAALAAAELGSPTCKGQLNWARTVLKDWEITSVICHHIPMPKQLAILIAFGLAVRGRGRLGAGVIFQQAKGLRPSELLSLLPEHITLPEQQHFGNSPAAVISLGVKTGTKLKRAQAVTVSEQSNPLALFLLRELVESTPKGVPIMASITLLQYQKELRIVCEKLGLPPLTPHSPRAGFATDQIISGRDFVSVREEGRWLSDSSLRIYLDQVAVAGQSASEAIGKHNLLIKELTTHFVNLYSGWPLSHFPLRCPLPKKFLQQLLP
ncbi:unnamed protein product [Polarella glacialis]|uniref:Uncharacterized protein n=1 Tax=Polarella glacialis TaxID=89957 RepID=A0A813DNW4_POLGL|nr:unnamed protein product [Polarella glacialis]